MRRKGELSPVQVDRDWPHKIVLKANDCRSRQCKVIADFCASLSLCQCGSSYIENDEWMRMFCFAEKADAGKIPGGIRRGMVRSGAPADGTRLVKTQAAEAEVLLSGCRF